MKTLIVFIISFLATNNVALSKNGFFNLKGSRFFSRLKLSHASTLGPIFLLFFSMQAFGRAIYLPKHEMIKKADAIAIISVEQIKDERNQGEYSLTYKQVAFAETEKVLKGTLPPKIEILSDEEFICAQCQFSKGRYIVFLHRVNERWACSNWELSVRPIENGKVDWYKGNAGTELAPDKLENVVQEITSLLAKAK